MSPSSGGTAMPAVARYAPSPRQMLWGVFGAFVLMLLLVGIAYATTSIPNPNDTATRQQTFFLYSNGKILAHGGQTNRVDVKLKDVPLVVQHAVLSAEDRNFESEPGISPTGIMRAFITDIRGGDIQQGGSTITQQYVKNAYLSQQRTFTRKIKEIFISLKLANERPKSEVLQDYLNTIYFGRNAYGIGAASQAYFGKSVTRLNASEAAVLAAVIRAPSFYDPAGPNRAATVARWHYVIDGMVKKHWLSKDEAARAQFPKVTSTTATSSTGDCTGDIGFICQAVRFDLQKHGFTEDRLAAGGYRVFTTIDQAAQKSAQAAETAHHGGYLASGPDKGRESALISVQPGDGAIRALYGGSAFCPTKQHPDSCVDLTGLSNSFHRSPGSSFKPYTVIAALQDGMSLDSRFPGPPHIDFPGTGGKGISNSQNESCNGECTLTEALARSINTVFVPLAQKVGPEKVAQVAKDAGVDTKKHPLDPVPTITLGTSEVSPLDQAVGYATIAAQGIEAAPYLVSKVVSSDGHVVYRAEKKTHRAFPADVMADTTYAMQQVLTGNGTAAGKGIGRPAAGKTGTNGQASGNFDAWFIGFTPQLSTAVWYGNTNRKQEVTNHGAPLYGGDLPALTWQQMMQGALQGKPVINFPPPAHVGHATNASPTATTSRTSTPTPSSNSPSPALTPTTVVTPTHTFSPPPVVSPSPTPTSTPTSTAGAGGGGGGGSPPA